MSRNLEDIFGGLATAPRQSVKVFHATASTPKVTMDKDFVTIGVTVNKGALTPGEDFTVDGRDVFLTPPLVAGDEAVFYLNTSWSPREVEGQYARVITYRSTGGENKYTADADFSSVLFFYDNKPWAPGVDYTTSGRDINFTNPMVADKQVYIILNGGKGALSAYEKRDDADARYQEVLQAIINSNPVNFPVANQTAMLALDAKISDTATRSDQNGRIYFLGALPASKLDNWKPFVEIANQVLSVNGRSGDVVVAEAGDNDDITSLNALSGPLRLGGDAVNQYDAVTLKQLLANGGSGSGGANMNGVMNSYLGAVHWFNGTRASIIAGHGAGDGQLLKRADYSDLWNAINSGVYVSVSDADWQSTPTARGAYSTGDGSTTFRLPDLNGVWQHPTNSALNSIPALFLRGDGAVPNTGTGVGVIRKSAAPNITGGLSAAGAASLQGGTGALYPNGPANVGTPPQTSSLIPSQYMFDASRSNSVYGQDSTTEVRPNSVKGIWIIRLNGKFSAANTNFNVINADTAVPANNTIVYGGDLVSNYQVAGADYMVSKFRSRTTIGGSASTKGAEVVIEDRSSTTVASKAFQFAIDGSFALPGGALRMRNLSGTQEMNIGINTADNSQAVINRTSGITALNFNGTQILYADMNYLTSPIVTRLANDPVNPGVGEYLNTPEIRSGFRSRGNYNGTPYAYVSLYSQEHVGDIYSGILQVSGFTANAAFYFVQNGNARAAGSWMSGSDIRHKFKKKMAGGEPKDALLAVMSWRGMVYQKLDGEMEVGLIAQDVEKSCPEAVSTSERKFSNGAEIKDFKSLNTSGASAAFHTEAIKGIVDLLDMILNDSDMARARERVAALKAAMVTEADLPSDSVGSVVPKDLL
ncbi:tail fiber protein [Erwinia phage vB_EamM-Bue1]|uniref:Minor tail protein n=1 Tax=Erwinia phage vB_EamM-Bue1 TaxID=2099338 RepID=A0A2P1JUF4_9CAUD|nr:tail fiber protein [Erwinia phage vB_EamM-Bue1]AVO22985.1 minor tail protein [Erwinia phage vB_EamM-Bue1]